MITLIVAHDIGGAHQIFSYILEKNIGDFLLMVDGPALGAAKELFPNANNFGSETQVESLLKANTIGKILTGTGWSSNFELNWIVKAKRLNIPCITFLDHWSLYKERFGYPRPEWTQQLPNEIWVSDQVALKLAQSAFPETKLMLKENYYFQRQLRKWKNQEKPGSESSVLFLTEPIADHYQSTLGYNEFDSLDLFFSKITKLLSNGSEVKITIRPHPSEIEIASSKYGKYLNKNVTLSKNENLFEDFSECSTVVGCDTIALYYASLIHRKVYCALPLKNSRCSLPIENLIYLRDL